MVECNLYVGTKGKLAYQFTETYESILDAELDAQDIAEMDAKEFGFPLSEAEWLAVETEQDDIPMDSLVGSKYL